MVGKWLPRDPHSIAKLASNWIAQHEQGGLPDFHERFHNRATRARLPGRLAQHRRDATAEFFQAPLRLRIAGVTGNGGNRIHQTVR